VIASGTIVDDTDTIAIRAPGLFPDTDNDGIVNPLDDDDDNDSVPDATDAFPLDSAEALDTDGDGIGNNADDDDDGDGVRDIYDSNPLDNAVADIAWARNAAREHGVSFLPTVPTDADWSLGAPSPNNLQDRITALERLVSDQRTWVLSEGLVPRFSFDYSYQDLNVSGLESAHAQGWTGLGSNLYIIDDFVGNQGPLFEDDIYGNVWVTHGASVFALAWAMAPEAEFNLVNYFGTSFVGLDLGGASNVSRIDDFRRFRSSTDTDADAANVSLGVHFTDYSSIETARTAAEFFVYLDMYSIAESLPNAVIVEAAGNNGTITELSHNRGCTAIGGRNTASSCTDVHYMLDPDYYDALDRTIFVGSYDFSTSWLTDYSVSAGDAADHFIVADGTSILDSGTGTSFAAPRVTGAIGLIAHKFPELSAQGRKGLVLDTATDLGAAGVDPVFGHGLLDVGRALNPLGMLR
jgi:hypothetical protein